jgi:phospholipid/cholesterol/gamma-HCH transport system substrate-binding protein
MGSLRGTLVRIAIFVMVCTLAWFVLVAAFGQLRFDAESTYQAVFSNVSGLKTDNFVRIAGVEVGKVKNIEVRDDATVLVEFTTDNFHHRQLGGAH